MSVFNPFGKKEPSKDTAKEDKKDVKQDNSKATKETGDPTDEKKEGSNVCLLKRGDYMIHIKVEEARNFVDEDADTVVNPIVEMKLMSQSKFTTAQDDINNTATAIWNEHLFYEFKNKEVEELEKAQLEIKVMDKNYWKDVLLGYYSFDLAFLYKQENHSMMHKWIVMTNPELADYGKVTC